MVSKGRNSGDIIGWLELGYWCVMAGIGLPAVLQRIIRGDYSEIPVLFLGAAVVAAIPVGILWIMRDSKKTAEQIIAQKRSSNSNASGSHPTRIDWSQIDVGEPIDAD